MLSNLLQELALAEDCGRRYIVLDEARLSENPVDRLSRMIRYNFWDGLTRHMDAEGLEKICMDPKNRSANHSPRIYIPYTEDDVFDYYQHVAQTRPHLGLEVERLPKDITPEFVQSINDRPGILALALKKSVDADGKTVFRGVPFVVPGGRFNEMYGWDSYFEALGLLIDERIDLAQGMVDHFTYEIKHYGKILNANRSYYLSRSQPPFLTDMAKQVFVKLPKTEENKQWLRGVLQAAIKEYDTVWMAEPRLDPKTQLSRFRPAGKGIPPETEASHFDHVILPYAQRLGLSIPEYMKQYNSGTLKEPELDEYFLHDRAVRESGHDTTYRYEGRCGNLATIDLNTLLYKYETDIADMIEQDLDGDLCNYQGVLQQADMWRKRAEERKKRIDRYLWNEEAGMYFDYDTVTEKQSDYESVTTLWAMWAKCASQEQAERMVRVALPKFEVTGGLVSGTAESRGKISLDRPNRQWDFPFGWAPHQILAWAAFENYGMQSTALRLAYRWLYILTHKVQVEYGNVGVDFKYVPREGFGWMNASYQIGLSMLTKQMRRALGTCTPPDVLFEKDQPEHMEEAAKAITQNGQTTTAITLIDPDTIITTNKVKTIEQPSTPSLSPEPITYEEDTFYDALSTPADIDKTNYFA
ncbi:trehalase [Rhizopus delemar RA 99-880]|uniref:Trehalase n=1 Tax=Rhizopus delemar (strain RA 99-880 / ATCC MYA-4621 / FGSC 9543 / NRRL 43880) TaxID=246409 RepID=I1CHY6_RHIO9|nr:trehalase [Rhizopus delemar RA 99-880]|eukprot:EIE88066.1 trehalase [Rhizopus delemar RA 99-880]